MAHRTWQRWELDMLALGAQSIPGRPARALIEKRRGLKRQMGPKPARQSAQSRLTEQTFSICSHTFVDLAQQAIPGIVDRPHYASTQLRVCAHCGCSQVRLWTVNGYATAWHQPRMPMGEGE